MYEATTNEILVRVEPHYLEDQSDPDNAQYFWAYTVEIINQSGQSVQLQARYWRIVDANGKVEEVRGAGVVGETPLIAPGESFSYTSGVPLSTPSGFMSGAYQMQDADGDWFEVEIPVFSLDFPDARRRVN